MLCNALVVGARGVLNPPPPSPLGVCGVLQGVEGNKALLLLLEGLVGVVGGRRGS